MIQVRGYNFFGNRFTIPLASMPASIESHENTNRESLEVKFASITVIKLLIK